MDALVNAKVGDVLLIYGGSCYKRLDQVVKVTKTQVHGNTGKWRKSGREIGTVGRYDRVYAKLATREDIAMMKEADRRVELINLIEDATSAETLRTWTTDDLERLLSVLKVAKHAGN